MTMTLNCLSGSQEQFPELWEDDFLSADLAWQIQLEDLQTQSSDIYSSSPSDKGKSRADSISKDVGDEEFAIRQQLAEIQAAIQEREAAKLAMLMSFEDEKKDKQERKSALLAVAEEELQALKKGGTVAHRREEKRQVKKGHQHTTSSASPIERPPSACSTSSSSSSVSSASSSRRTSRHKSILGSWYESSKHDREKHSSNRKTGGSKHSKPSKINTSAASSSSSPAKHSPKTPSKPKHASPRSSPPSSSSRSSSSPSAPAPPPKPAPAATTTSVTCAVCQEDRPSHSTAALPCSHSYCGGCLDELLRRAAVDESLWPPRCCRQRIPLPLPERAGGPSERDAMAAAMAKLVAPATVDACRAKNAEMSVPPAERVYCAATGCGAWIPPSCHVRGGGGSGSSDSASTSGEIAGFDEESVSGGGGGGGEGVATCLKCSGKTCLRCRGVAHPDAEGGECPRDEATQEFLRVAEACGWARCFACRRFVELEHGCNHMTCRCGAEFCYVCGKRWKTCGCAQWDEERLLERATHIAAERGEVWIEEGLLQPRAQMPRREREAAAAAAAAALVLHDPRRAFGAQLEEVERQRQRRPVIPFPMPQGEEPPVLDPGHRAAFQHIPLYQPNDDDEEEQNQPPEPQGNGDDDDDDAAAQGELPNNNRQPAAWQWPADLLPPPPPPPAPQLQHQQQPQPQPHQPQPLPVHRPHIPLDPQLFRPNNAAPPLPPLPLARDQAEFDRMRASVRAVVGMLNAVLAELEEEGPPPPRAPQQGRPPPQPAQQQQQQQQQGDGGGCAHAHWQPVPDEEMHRCEACAGRYGVDIFYRGGAEGGLAACAAPGCGMRACRFCRRNRL